MVASHDVPELIPLNVLFGNADKRMPRLSPDGKYYAYLADAENGVTNIFLKPVQWESATSSTLVDTSTAQQLTNETHRPLRHFEWAKSVEPRRILYIQDTDGDEDFHLHVVEFHVDEELHGVDSIQLRDLTPFGAVTVSAIELSDNFPNAVIAAVNKRDPRFFDAYKIDLSTGDCELVVENPGDVNQWLVNDAFEVVGGFAMDAASGSQQLRVKDAQDETQWKTLVEWPHGETCHIHTVAEDGKSVFVETSLSHGDGAETNTSRLVRLSLEDGSVVEVLAQDDKSDVSKVSFRAKTQTVRYVTFDYTKPRVHIIDEYIRADLEHLISQCTGEFELVSDSEDGLTWLYADSPDNASVKYYIFDRRTRRQALLFDSRPELAKYSLVEMTPHVIKTSDDEDMVVYVSLPNGVEAKNLPFVLRVHGGPWARDVWGFHPEHQLFANRGYGCISVNFRSSTGYGKRWTNLGDLQWGASMQQDLTDSVQWLIKQGLADPDRIAIYGGSYGGYATLAGLAFTPDLYTCGVDIVGPSNVQTLFSTIPPYWTAMKRMLELRVGEVEKDDEFNRKISPLYHADKMKKPLLIAQGANDPRVKQAESDQIAKELHANKHEVQYVLYKDEGHGFARPPNRLDFMWRTETFLASHLGGRVLPKDEEVIKGNSAVVVDTATL
ncbi:hypothetical protein Poli38472_013225 [Pythium oligandrum]|uniref:Peptidase S9 prolyl oligopeptidase catalytic domain-containing protein n=1 Tax=Pythium oligandrum TaxID=41045 RepID=A0A8K1FC00_PYTOL|nr:hypothetical protein Poli38472_013225 [Pythium oligandrum]|eukprot:TMW55334.1 hypothetical protein Poli38472_013225 [Pythium oligandrum]